MNHGCNSTRDWPESFIAQHQARHSRKRPALEVVAARTEPKIVKRPGQSITEHQEQCAVIAWADAVATQGRMPGIGLIFAIPNGGKRGKAEASRFKAEGVRAGVCDLFLPVARRGFHGLFIEMKSQRGKASESQMQFVQSVRAQGFCAAVCFGSDSAIKALEWYYSPA